MDRKTQLTFLWFGPAMAVLFGLAFVGLAGMVPPPGPSLSAVQVADFYAAHPLEIGVAMVIILMAMGMLAPWASVLALRLRRVEGKYPVLMVSQLINIAVAVTIVVLCPIFWAAAAFRAGDTSPDVVRALNDVAFIIFLAPWPPFSFWIWAMSWAILADRSATPEFPRWVAFLGLGVGVLFLPAALVMVLKKSVFAWDGIFGFYVPLTAFFSWLVAVTVYAMRGVRRETD